MHHPFTAPKDEDMPLLDTSPGKVRAKSYDFVCNGSEISSGSIRIHTSELQRKVCRLLGYRDEDIEERFSSYIDSCRRTFRVELILTSFEDLVESEFGAGIHEKRILDQRDLASDFGRIAQNASSIIEYMLTLATSPTIRIDHLPIKIWGRYIRDTVSHAIADLDGGEPTEWLVPEEHLERLMPL